MYSGTPVDTRDERSTLRAWAASAGVPLALGGYLLVNSLQEATNPNIHVAFSSPRSS
jgi:hypothetical protein